MRLQGETRELEVELTLEEREEMGQKLALAIETEDDYRKAYQIWLSSVAAGKKRQTAELERLHGEASDLAEIVRTGEVQRDVACTWLYALAAGYAFLVRDDTGELVAHRKLRDEERQLALDEPPFREPTPEQLDEWLKALPVNEEQELPEGHAQEVTAENRVVDLLLDPELDEFFGPSSDELTVEDHDPLLDPGGYASEETGQDEDGNTLGGDDDWDGGGEEGEKGGFDAEIGVVLDQSAIWDGLHTSENPASAEDVAGAMAEEFDDDGDTRGRVLAGDPEA